MSIDLDAIEARLAAATPGPWEARALAYSTCVGKVGEYQNLARLGDPLDRQAWRNADLIAHAPTDLAALVAENERLRAVAEAISILFACEDFPADCAIDTYNDAVIETRAALDAWRVGEG